MAPMYPDQSFFPANQGRSKLVTPPTRLLAIATFELDDDQVEYLVRHIDADLAELVRRENVWSEFRDEVEHVDDKAAAGRTLADLSREIRYIREIRDTLRGVSEDDDEDEVEES